MYDHTISTDDEIIAFMKAGRALFTVENTDTNARYTYRITHKEVEGGRSLWFVGVLTGPDNTSSYTFLGTIFDGGNYHHSKKSSIGFEAPSSIAFRWLLWRLLGNKGLPASIKFWHHGTCGRCGRSLTVPASIASGIGPVCATKAA